MAFDKSLGKLWVEFGAKSDDFISGVKSVRREIETTDPLLGKHADTIQSVGKAMTAAGAAITGAGLAVAAGIGVSVKAAVDWETAFTGVVKTAGELSSQNLPALEQGLRSLALTIPMAASELAVIAEAAGQLGIDGVDNVLAFTEVVAQLGVTTNLSGEEAATTLARFANITQMSMSEVSNLGSVIVHLGNNMATTESEIAAFGLRIAGAGHQVGLTQGQIMAFGAALSSVGVEADAGGTAISKVFIAIAQAVANGGEELDKFAKISGMSASEFQRAFQEDAATATVTFIEGLKGISDSGGNVFATLADLGFQEIRVRDALLRSASAGDLLRNALDMQNTAWIENTALTDEAALRFATTESQGILLKNAIADLTISVGDALKPALDTLLKALLPVINGFANFARDHPNITAALTVITVGLSGMAITIGTLITGLGLLAWNVNSVANILAVVKTPAVIAATKAMIAHTASVWATIAPYAAWVAALAIVVVSVGLVIIAIKEYMSYLDWKAREEEAHVEHVRLVADAENKAREAGYDTAEEQLKAHAEERLRIASEAGDREKFELLKRRAEQLQVEKSTIDDLEERLHANASERQAIAEEASRNVVEVAATGGDEQASAEAATGEKVKSEFEKWSAERIKKEADMIGRLTSQLIAQRPKMMEAWERLNETWSMGASKFYEDTERFFTEAEKSLSSHLTNMANIAAQRIDNILDELGKLHDAMDEMAGDSWLPDLLQRASDATRHHFGLMADAASNNLGSMGSSMERLHDSMDGAGTSSTPASGGAGQRDSLPGPQVGVTQVFHGVDLAEPTDRIKIGRAAIGALLSSARTRFAI